MSTIELDAETASDKPGPARVAALIELAVIIATFFAIRHLAQNYELIGAGSMGVLASVAVGTVLMKRRGRTWTELGLKWPQGLKGWGATVLLIVLAMAMVFYGIPNVVVPLIFQLFENPTFGGFDHKFSFFYGKPLVFAAYLILVGWIGAAIGEELFARGLLMNHMAEALGFTKFAWLLALLGQAAFFGLAHAYQGPTGMIITGAVGLFFGIVYLLGWRSLVPVIIAHGLVDTISLTQLYMMNAG